MSISSIGLLFFDSSEVTYLAVPCLSAVSETIPRTVPTISFLARFRSTYYRLMIQRRDGRPLGKLCTLSSPSWMCLLVASNHFSGAPWMISNIAMTQTVRSDELPLITGFTYP